MDYLKAERVGKSKWRVRSIPFGGPLTRDAVEKMGVERPDNGIGFDSDAEYFSKRTDIKPDWFDRRPLVWHHNLDTTMKADPVIGTADDLEEEDDGWWTTLWLDRQHRYFARIDALLQDGKGYGSTGTLPAFAKTDAKTGEILVWPFIEQTLTPVPANTYSVVVPVKSSHFDLANITLPPAVRGIIDLNDSPEADLPADLPEPGGDEAAMRRRLEALANYEAARLSTL